MLNPVASHESIKQTKEKKIKNVAKNSTKYNLLVSNDYKKY